MILAWACAAQANCRQALILALDVSGSVDGREYRLQTDGLARALQDPDVVEALLQFPDAPVSLAVFEWSSSKYQQLILDWTLIEGPGDIALIAGRLRSWERRPTPKATAIGSAMLYAAELFEAGLACWRMTLDVSGDGKNNNWPLPQDVRTEGILAGVTINGLVIGQDKLDYADETAVHVGELSAYYASNVAQGEDAFVEVALGYGDYAEAMTKKLLRELESPAIGRAPKITDPIGSVDIADLVAPIPFDPVQH